MNVERTDLPLELGTQTTESTDQTNTNLYDEVANPEEPEDSIYNFGVILELVGD